MVRFSEDIYEHCGRTDSRSYIVDFEVCDGYNNDPEHELKFTDDEYIYWCLAQSCAWRDTLTL